MQDIVKASERPREKVINYNICVVTKSLVLHSFVCKGRKIQAHEILLFQGKLLISLVILLTVSHTILVILVGRIWLWIN